MKIFIPLLILMSLLITEAVAQTPGPPTGLKITAQGDRQVTLSWSPPSNTGAHPISYYRYHVAETDGDWTNPLNWSLVGKTFVPRTSLTHTFNFNLKVTYRVRAVSTAEEDGTPSAPLVVTLQMPAPTGFTATTADRTVTLRWTAVPNAPTGSHPRAITGYEYSQNGGTWTPTGGGTSTTKTVTGLKNGVSHTFRVRAVRSTETNHPAQTSGLPKGLPSRTVTVTPLGPAPGSPGTLNVQRVEDTATLTWSPSRNTGEQILRYEYSEDDGSTWTSTESTDTTYTVTGLEAGETYTFVVRAVYVDGETSRIISHRSRSSNSAVLNFPKPKRRIIQDCPVGWVRSDGFAGRNRRVLLYEVKLQMDIHNRVSIYKPDWVAIYVHPDEGLENLDGWKLQVALPYNQPREYPLTTENSVVVNAGFVEGGFAFIENPEEDPFPMVGVGFTGSPAPGFDYRLYDETGKRVDFGISCYKRGDIFQVLKEMEDPRVLRKVLLESFDWDAHYLRSEWTVPVPVNVQGAPSLQRGNLVGTWADLKKQ